MLEPRRNTQDAVTESPVEVRDPSSYHSRLAEVLVSEHRQRMQSLRALEDQARRGPVDPTGFERTVLGLGAHLASETVLTDPVIRHVLERPDHFGLYRVEVRLIMRTLDRAGSELDRPREFLSAINDARRGYTNLAYRGELEVLTFLHHAYTPQQQRRLATSYPMMRERILRRYRRQRSVTEPPWTDQELVPSLQRFFEEELAREIPEQQESQSSRGRRGSAATSSSRRASPSRARRS